MRIKLSELKKIIREAIEDEDIIGFGRDYNNSEEPKEKSAELKRHLAGDDRDSNEETEEQEDDEHTKVYDEIMSDTCLYPHVHVSLVGEDGNAFSILGRVIKAMRRGKVPQDKIDEFKREATSGDYNKLLQTCMKWVDCD
jgi:hypothetical protein